MYIFLIAPCMCVSCYKNQSVWALKSNRQAESLELKKRLNKLHSLMSVYTSTIKHVCILLGVLDSSTKNKY